MMMIGTLRNRLYRVFIHKATRFCYQFSLDYFPPESSILDVGIGNGMMIRNFHSVIHEKNLKITGIDINRHYLKHCLSLIQEFGLQNNIRIFHQSVEAFQPPVVPCFDYVLFSMSFMLFADQQKVLNRVRKWIKPGGRLVFFQTMFRNRSRLMEFIKPRLIYLTSVDFGTVTYEDRFLDFLTANGISVTDDIPIKKEWFQGEYRMIAASPLPLAESPQASELPSALPIRAAARGR